MTQLAVGYKTLSGGGREHKTDGLMKHLGLVDTSSLRVSGSGGYPPLHGAGIEQLYGASTGYIQSFDRDLNQYTDLVIAGRNVTLLPNSPGGLVLPNGAITTPMLAAGAAQQLIGSYIGAAPFSTTVVGSWIETPFQVTAVFSGATVRIEGVLPLYHSVLAAGMYVGWGIDGSVGRGNVYCNAPAPNYTLTNSFVDYYTPNPGTHRWSLFVYNATAGTLSFNAAVYAMLHLTEQKR